MGDDSCEVLSCFDMLYLADVSSVRWNIDGSHLEALMIMRKTTGITPSEDSIVSCYDNGMFEIGRDVCHAFENKNGIDYICHYNLIFIKELVHPQAIFYGDSICYLARSSQNNASPIYPSDVAQTYTIIHTS